MHLQAFSQASLSALKPMADFIPSIIVKKGGTLGRGIEQGILEGKFDSYGKDRMFSASFAFCVITFKPIKIKTHSAPQKDRLNFSFVKSEDAKT